MEHINVTGGTQVSPFLFRALEWPPLRKPEPAPAPEPRRAQAKPRAPKKPQLKSDGTVDRRFARPMLSIPLAQVKEFEAGELNARKRGINLNRFVTVRPTYLDDLTIEERATAWWDFYRRLSTWLANNHVPLFMLWSREAVRRTGAGEHWHLRLALPPEKLERFTKWLHKRFPGSREVDIGPADDRALLCRDGKIHNLNNYMTKAASYGAINNTRRRWKPSGYVHGKRAGATPSLLSEKIVNP